MPAFNSGIVGNTDTCSHFILCTCFSYVLLVLYSETYYSVFCSTLAHLLIELRYSVLNLNMPYSIFEKKIRQKFLNFNTFRKKDEFHLLHDKIRQMVECFFLLGAKPTQMVFLFSIIKRKRFHEFFLHSGA